mmetsp:Transcript_26996/g.63384  ORF Transcript_26996/g.63384 Transcript_26996/m.63384 type:complete len:128 (+) Transcript_26996:266-649(+)
MEASEGLPQSELMSIQHRNCRNRISDFELFLSRLLLFPFFLALFLLFLLFHRWIGRSMLDDHHGKSKQLAFQRTAETTKARQSFVLIHGLGNIIHAKAVTGGLLQQETMGIAASFLEAQVDHGAGMR